MKTAIRKLLRRHGYSASPWECSCGEALLNADIDEHRAEVIASYLESR